MKKKKIKKIINIISILIMIASFSFMAKEFWISHFNLRIRIIQIIFLIPMHILFYYELAYKGLYKDKEDYNESMFKIFWKLFLISAIYVALEILIGGRYFE